MDAINKLLKRYIQWSDNKEDISDVQCVPHYCIPRLNIHLEKDSPICENVPHFVENYEKLPYTIFPSIPFGEPAICQAEVLNGLDPSVELLRSKKRWEECKNKLILANLKSKGHDICMRKGKGVKGLSPGILKLAEHLDTDPDPNFCGHYMYNWYQSGGNLNIMSHKDNHALLFTRYSTPGVIHVMPLNITESCCIPLENKKLCLHTDKKQVILQSVIKDNFIAVRQKKFATLFFQKGNSKLKFKRIHQNCETDDSIVDIAVSNNSDGEYCTLTTSRTIKIWSTQRKSECQSFMFDEKSYKDSCDQWGCVKYLSEHNFLFCTRNCIYFKDRRSNLNIDLKWWQPNTRSNCDYISLLMMSSSCNSNIAFVGTKHSLFELDFRKGFTKEWTHMMEFAPMYGTSSSIVGDSETLFISSQNMNEVCLIESSKPIVPFMLPSPSDTITYYKFQGMCLVPMVTTRCNFSATGLSSIPFKNKNGNGAYVFRSSSLGDNFFQKIFFKNEGNVDDLDHYKTKFVDQEILLVWQEKCNESVENISNKPLEVTNIVDKTKTYESLIKNEGNKHEFNKQNSTKRRKPPDDSWRVSKKSLLNTDNPLAQCLLSEWDIDDDEEWYPPVKASCYPKGDSCERINSNSRVESWFSELPNSTAMASGSSIINTHFSNNSIADSTLSSPNKKIVLSSSRPEINLTSNKDANENLASAFAKKSVPPNFSNHKDIFNLEDYCIDTFTNTVRSSHSLSFNVDAKKVLKSTVNKSKFNSGF